MEKWRQNNDNLIQRPNNNLFDGTGVSISVSVIFCNGQDKRSLLKGFPQIQIVMDRKVIYCVIW